jgi:hypothetical protein
LRRGLPIILLAIFTIATLQVYSEKNRGVGILETPSGSEIRIGRQYLVVIAVNEYQHWTPLRSPVPDGKKLKDILVSRYHFDELYELYDEQATKGNIIKLFVDLQKKVKREDALLIVYSGHGHLDESSDTGFWIPVNAGTDVYEQKNWLPHAQLRGLISNLESMHVLVISDSCFAGDLIYSTRSLPKHITAEYFKSAYSLVSRQLLTSGVVEVVPDESAFADQLISVLKYNDHPVLDTLMLFNEVRLGVEGSTPLMGSLAGTGHQEGASFLLFLRDESVPTDHQASAGAEAQALPYPSEGSPAELAGSGPRRPKRFSAGLSCGFWIGVGVADLAFKTGPVASWRMHYCHFGKRGEIIAGMRAGMAVLTGMGDISNPFYPDPWDMTSFPVVVSLGYATVFDPLLYFCGELEAGIAINSITIYTPDEQKTYKTKLHLGAAAGVGLRLLDRLKVTVYGRFTSVFFDDPFLSISPEISVEYTF